MSQTVKRDKVNWIVRQGCKFQKEIRINKDTSGKTYTSLIRDKETGTYIGAITFANAAGSTDSVLSATIAASCTGVFVVNNYDFDTIENPDIYFFGGTIEVRKVASL